MASGATKIAIIIFWTFLVFWNSLCF
ncbi:MAG: hypothetical protein WBA61_00530 [Aequorivita sp.]